MIQDEAFLSPDPLNGWCDPASPCVVRTDTNGEARIFAQMSLSAATNLITASVTTAEQTTNVLFTAYNGLLTQMSIVSGDNQMGLTEHDLTNPLVVRVTNTNGVPLPNAPVELLLIQGDAFLSPDTMNEWCNPSYPCVAHTGTNGEASIFVQLGTLPGTNFITASVTAAGQTTNVEFTVYATDTVPDSTPPSLTSSLSPLTNSAGWHRSNVTVHFAATDEESGITYVTPDAEVSEEGANQEITGIATNGAGLTASLPVTVNLDKTAPTLNSQLSPAPNSSGWNNSALTVHWNASDSLSGTNFVTADTLINTEGTNAVVNGIAVDNAGNTNTATTAAIKLDMTAPDVTATVSPAPNANGWNTNSVTVTFTATDGLSGVATYSSPVTVTNELADEVVEGIAIDAADNTNATAAFISIDKHAPALTGSPADGDTINQLRPPFVIEYTDELSGVDLSSLLVTLDGTNVTANFQPFASGAIWTPTNDMAVGSHVWNLSVSDYAGLAASASATFTITTNSPLISNLNISSGTTMPDVEAVWIQGKRADSNTVVTYSVNFGSPQPFNGRWDQFGMLVPLDFGTNIVSISGSKAGAGVSGLALTVVRSDRYRAKLNAPSSGDLVMDGPAMGYFANGEPQTVSGYVSELNDEGLPSESGISSVSINGLACILRTADASGNLPFDTGTNTVSVSTNFTSATVTICYSNAPCYTVPLGLWEGYFITKKQESFGNLSPSMNPTAFIREPGGYCGSSDWVVAILAAFYWELKFDRDTKTEAFTQYSRWPTSPPCVSSSGAPHFEDISLRAPFDSVTMSNTNKLQPTSRSLSMGVSEYQEYRAEDNDGNGSMDKEIVKIDWVNNPVSSNSITFTAPAYYGEGTPVIFTFEGVNYVRAPGEPLDLTQVLYNGESPVVTNNANGHVGYLLNVTGCEEYTINSDLFTWPDVSYTYPTTIVTNGTQIVTTDATLTAQRLTFTGFHNAIEPCEIAVKVSDPKESGLQFPASLGFQNLGLHDSPNAWVSAVEIKATLHEGEVATGWGTHQRYTGKKMGVVKKSNGTIVNFTENLNEPSPGEDPEAAFVKRQGNLIYWIDAPGHKKNYKGGKVDSLVQIQNFTSWVKKGSAICEVKWHVKLVIQDGGVLDTEHSFTGSGHLEPNF